MKSIVLLKIITGFMAVLIVAGFALIIHKIADSSQKIKPDTVVDKIIPLKPSEKIQDMFACGEQVCVRIQKQKEAERLIIISPKTGKIQQVMTFLEKDIN